MAGVIPNEGETLMLQRVLSVNSLLKLFTNDYTPDDTTVLSDMEEAAGSGYAQKTLVPGSWVITNPGDAQAAYAKQDFVLSGAMTVYGYYITDSPATKILAVERFSDGPYIVPAGGGTVSVTPTLNLE